MAVTYNPSQKRLQKAYTGAMEHIADYLISQLSLDTVDLTEVVDQVSILRQLEVMLRDLDTEAYAEISEAISDRFNEARLQYYVNIGDVKTLAEAAEIAPFTMLNKQKLQMIIADTQADLLAATQNTETALKQIVREAVEKRLTLDSLTGKGVEQMANQLVKDLSTEGLSKLITEDGFIGIIDKAGKRWNLKSYADMVVNTKLLEADTEAARVEGLQTGVDLAVISQHGATDDCAKWENVIVSMNGLTEGYPSYAEVKATKECFHPNCEHILHPVRTVELIHPKIVAASESKMEQNWQTLQKTE